ncbi:transcriptional regulator, TetR family [Nocardia amikacinitolerans]|uniref:Transcriptional regulator, TetR family n=1 Tax=Nocardia amikacinitolerans TaxID=756689 RepID=A0A285LN06_9NOCA|nr:TetR/AcrR family transcriptional regulator [Nocardia amikacinitolerans]MCP2298423.1 transcriptional regulator, TetR family [Nocardia amikacinitolerans]SNY84761.1 transcriptional regulator, TetR family [Nocardia amikacinitolerans]
MAKQFTSVWTRELRQPRASGLDRAQIVAAAREILDSEGLDALSMRKIGAKLNAGATSLYWYVANKDELLELVLDEFWGMLRAPESEQASWREVLTAFAYSLRGTMRAHPWVAGLIGHIPSIGPNAMRMTDRLRRAFTEAGFHGVDIYLASGTVMSFVLGQVLPEIAYAKAVGEDYDTEGILQAMSKVTADYPEMFADYREVTPTDPEVARALAFDFGLVCVLDGLELRLRDGDRSRPRSEAAARDGS